MITGVGPLRFFLYPNIMTIKEEKIYLSKCRDGQTMQGWPVWTWPNVEASAPHGCAGDRRREIWPPTASGSPLKKIHRPGSKPLPLNVQCCFSCIQTNAVSPLSWMRKFCWRCFKGWEEEKVVRVSRADLNNPFETGSAKLNPSHHSQLDCSRLFLDSWPAKVTLYSSRV